MLAVFKWTVSIYHYNCAYYFPTHTLVEAEMPCKPLLACLLEAVGFSVLLKDTPTCSQESGAVPPNLQLLNDLLYGLTLSPL